MKPHIIAASTAANSDGDLPPKVEAAFRFAYFFRDIETAGGNPFAVPGDLPKESSVRNDPSRHERDVYYAALNTIREYLNEPGFAPGEAPRNEASGPDDPGQRSLIPVAD